MQTREFIRTVAERSALSREESADLTRATLETLADRLSASEAGELARQLPEPLNESLVTRTAATEKFGLEEFIGRVSKHTGLTVAETTGGVRAVFTTLHDLLARERFDHVMAPVPDDFLDLAAAT